MTDVNSFSEAKARLGIALDGGGDTITISRADAEILKGSYLPGNPTLPSGSCSFDASLVPFLASAIDHNCFRYFEIGGISVIPHILGGVHLVSTNGIVVCMSLPVRERGSKLAKQSRRAAHRASLPVREHEAKH